ncbi:hypothetical protein BC939DRAFT_418123 [Gamsiella multidivaricata]|uniref:uncharacterized protein n=1 Tax=Gamsiella multidivaricata TaxID=101098 RepID=UPI002220C8C5|nr:uncharacterized protein BC939DRAFT_418123 [Gamsiella multidivaricata]KAG0364844.1 hypothetical protein BGZ54_007096 [Gamsiella multidivaricata]KAI7832640.1 hypothetical protein BC939DRAFT_418123 [Gamsiella multidivaricata]
MMLMNSFRQPKFWKTYFTPNRYSYDQIPDLTGKVAIVTGANTGIGYATTVGLAGQGAHVILACRSKERAMAAIERAKKEIKEKYPNAPKPRLEFLDLDLNDMRKCRDAAKSFLERGLPLHILICNSGIMVSPFELSADGIETQFAVNHMGHFVFTTTLLDRIKESQPSRIVIVSSIAHEGPVSGGIDFETLNDPSKSDNVSRYGRSKLANILFTKALARRMAGEHVHVNVLHPGYVSTELIRFAKDKFGFVQWVTNMIGVTPEMGALTQLYLATSPEVESQDIRGRYFIPIANELQPTAYAQDEELQEKLWKFSEELVREKIGA